MNAPIRRSERQRVTGQKRPAWPGKAMKSHWKNVHRCERRRRQPRSDQLRPAWPGNAMKSHWKNVHRCERRGASRGVSNYALRGRGTQ